MIDLFMNGSSLTGEIQSLHNVNVNNCLTNGNYFIKTDDTSNMPDNYKNGWVWLFVRNSLADNRGLQILCPDNSIAGWIAFRTIGQDGNGNYWYDIWDVIDFKQGKMLLGGVKPYYRLYYATSLKEVA